ncbi:MAG: hypothetical protein WC906_02245 [Parcubacteria group bacterium]|jgi:hypothetical protein
MPKEKSSREMAQLAAKLMKSKNSNVRRLAASVLTQHEHEKKTKK